MKISIKIIEILIINVLLSSILFSQSSLFNNETFALHIRCGIAFSTYSSSFGSLQGPDVCGSFNSGGSGTGLAGQLIGLEIPVSPKSHIGLAFSFTDKGGTLKSYGSFQQRDTVTGNIIQVQTGNYINTKLSYFSIRPEFFSVITDKLINGPFRFSVGLNIDIPIQHSFSQYEKIVSPENATFNDKGKQVREREIYSDNISNMNIPVFGIVLGLENMLKTGENSFFTQQLVLEYNLNNFVNGIDWNGYAFKLNLGYRFGFSNTKIEVIDTIITIPEKPKKKTIPEKVISKKEIIEPILDLNIKSLDFKVNTGVELLATLPIINAVFFDRNSSEIPEYYIKSLNNNIDVFRGDAVDIHKFVLPRISKILLDNPKATLIICGATSGKRNEPEGLSLARKRAEEIKKVFFENGISNRRIKTLWQEFPENMSNQDFPLGQIENQRVDMILENASLQEYISLQRFKELKGRCRFITGASNLKNDSILIFTTNIDENPRYIKPGQIIDVDFKRRIGDEEINMAVTSELVYNNIIKTASIIKNINHNDTSLVELYIENFNAILRFDYNSSTLSGENKILLDNMVKILPTGIKIIVSASSDALGTDERNTVLTRERAGNTCDYLKKIGSGKFEIIKSTTFAKFPEETQQGRFLNRSLRIRLGR